MRRLSPLLLLTLIPLAAPSAAAQTVHVEEGRLLPPAGAGFSDAGRSVAFSAGRVAVGDPRSSAPGRVHTFTTSAGLWQLDATADSLDGATNDRFGQAVALDGDTLLVGAPGSGDLFGNGPGAAYVFTRTGATWTQQQKFVPSNPKSQGLFGAAVALDGNTLVIGAPQIDPGSQGEVLVYVRTAGVWSLQQKLVPSGLFGAARLGSSVAIEGDRIVIGARTNSPDMVTPVGQAFVYERTGSVWTKTAVLDSPLGITGGKFGGAVALDGDRIAVGAPGEPQTAAEWGRVHLFTRVGASWVLEQTLAGVNTSTQNCRFGAALALEGTRLLVGAPGHTNAAASTAGTVKLFERVGSTWSEALDIYGSGASFNGKLGESVALSGDLVVGGAPFADEAYVWRLNPPTPFVYCTAKVASPGCVPSIGWTGAPSASSASPFLVTATQVVSQKFGILFYGHLYNQTPFQGGVLCVASPTTRTAAQFSGGSPGGNDCTGAFAFDFNAYTQGGGDPALVAGTWVWSQYWFRDPPAANGSGLSNALRFRIQP